MVHEGEMRRSEDEFSDTISKGMSAAVVEAILFEGLSGGVSWRETRSWALKVTMYGR